MATLQTWRFVFAAYESVFDLIFKANMTTQQDAYWDSLEDFTVGHLIEVVLNKYKILLETDKWDTSLEKNLNIISFIAEVHVLNQRELIIEFLFDTPPHHSEQTPNIKQSIWTTRGSYQGSLLSSFLSNFCQWSKFQWKQTEQYAQAYERPESYRTSNQVER